MRYENNGVEIQYRECQILRDAAKKLLADGENADSLVNQRDRWIQAIRDTAEKSEAKRKFALPAAQFLSGMREEYLESVAEYTVSLVKKGRGLTSWFRFSHPITDWFSLSIHTLPCGMETGKRRQQKGIDVLERKILFGLTLAVSKQIRGDLERTAASKIPCLQSVCRYRKDGIYQYVKQQPENVLIILEENLQGASPYTTEEIQQLTDLGNNRIIFLMDRCHYGDEFVHALYCCGVYDAVYLDEVSADGIMGLIKDGRWFPKRKSPVVQDTAAVPSEDYNEMTDFGQETGAEILETGKPDTEIPETAESLGKDVEDMFAVMERFRMMTAADAEISVAGTNETDLMIVMGNYLRTVDV